MNRFGSLFLGIFGAFGVSWIGMVAYPYLTFAALQPHKDENTGAVAPPGLPGVAAQGYRTYAGNGCVTCHTQFVRDKNEGSDIDRKWGNRRTVARDYMFEGKVVLGDSRSGPDLSNVGVRQTDPQWFYRLLLDPRLVDPASSMPAYPWLFKTQKIVGQRSADALRLEGEHAPAAGYEIIPTEQARNLVGYLLSRKANYPLPEAPEPKE
jgi:cytochrome c oxidase cbb3-type subunit II